MRASAKFSLYTLFCLATALAVGAEIYFEENFPDGEYYYLLLLCAMFDKTLTNNNVYILMIPLLFHRFF